MKITIEKARQMIAKYPGWEVQETSSGFYIYTHSSFEGCVRQNPINGATEVFVDPAEEVIAEPIRDGAVFEEGSGVDGGEEALKRALLFVDILPL